MAKLILGLAGEMGSGKGVITKYVVEKYSAGSYKFSQILRDVLDRIYVDQTRENISNLSFILRKNFGEDILAKSICYDVQKDGNEIIVLDGVRRIEDIAYLKRLSEFKLVYVDADMETCYERLIKRGENQGDNEKTFEQFKKDHEADADARILDLKNHADYIIRNDGTYEELYVQIDKVIMENLK